MGEFLVLFAVTLKLLAETRGCLGRAVLCRIYGQLCGFRSENKSITVLIVTRILYELG